MRRLLLIALALTAVLGCNQAAPPPPSATAEEVELLKHRMNDAFAGLEMYSADHSLTYPDTLEPLIPKYLDEIPLDPVSRRPIIYRKTDEGFLLSASGDYGGVDAEKGFPKMNQDGFYVKKDSEFPSEEIE